MAICPRHLPIKSGRISGKKLRNGKETPPITQFHHSTHKISQRHRSSIYLLPTTHTQVATINNLHNIIYIMLRLASVLALAVAGRIPSAVAFSPMIRAARIAGGQTTSLNYYPDETSLNPNYQQQGGGGGGGGIFPDTQHDISLAYDRALDCANNFGMCDIDELLDLSEGK